MEEQGKITKNINTRISKMLKEKSFLWTDRNNTSVRTKYTVKPKDLLF